MYILKYYINSRYFGFNRVIYKEFKTYKDLMTYCYEHKIKDFDVYVKEDYEIIEVI